MSAKQLNIALIGRGFMGRIHSNAWLQARHFCDPPLMPVLHTACAKHAEGLDAYAAKWGWQQVSTDWQQVCASPEIDLVDLGVPNYLHASMAIAALKAGKHVACEKPLAGTLAEAREMMLAARQSQGRGFVWYSYRGLPAVAFARQLVQDGRIGDIRHVRAVYLQSWADENVPLAWRFDKRLAGSGSNGDLNAHIIDMTRFVTGEEITEIAGAIAETFVKERYTMVGQASGGIAEGLQKSQTKEPVTVDDAVLVLARFSGGAVASFEAARQATGNLNRHGFEINGTKGALRFNFERMTELEYCDLSIERGTRGWTTINCSDMGTHPYMDAWWPEGHHIGYEHTFINQANSILNTLAGREAVAPVPDFEDAYKTQRVLEAVMVAARERRPVQLSEIT